MNETSPETSQTDVVAEPEASGRSTAKPIYERVKDYIRGNIENGTWPVGRRIPSENELVDTAVASRMTIHKAMRELAAEGVIVRVQGRGSFVAPKKRSSSFLGVRSIADEIRERSGDYSAQVMLLQGEVCGPDLAETMECQPGQFVHHSVIVHQEDSVPIQLEDRFVSADVAPDYLRQDFTQITPNEYLTVLAPISRTEQSIEAVLVRAWEANYLGISRAEPCLLVRRRTWSNGRLASSVRLMYPGLRYQLKSVF